MDVSAVVLHKLLAEKDLDIFSRLKLIFLDPAYSTLYTLICKHYDKYGVVPSFEELELGLREGQAAKILASIRLLEVPQVSADLAINALIDQYTQAETIKLLEKFVSVLPICDSTEIKDQLANIALTIEEKTYTSESVFAMNDLLIFQKPEDTLRERIYLGLNNTFDSVLGGVARQELILIGGKRGSGKSLVSSNIFVSQYEMGNTSLYFTIEMSARETNMRNLAILSGVPASSIKKNELTQEQITAIAKARANMFIDGQDAFNEYLSHRDRFKFEDTLVRSCTLKPDNQMVIVDDRNLTLSAIDLNISKAKSKYGDKLAVVVVDYLNQIVLDNGVDQYDWKPQVEMAKKLKNIARKYDITLISPYQIDATGEARFSKGILDSADIALVLNAHEKEDAVISFDTTKIRGDADISFSSPINWSSLRISPTPVDRPTKVKEKKLTNKSSDEECSDIPWD